MSQDFPQPQGHETDDEFRRRAREWLDSGEERGSEGECLYLCSL
jgi:hypothetical protein